MIPSSRKVLILNQDYSALTICSVKKAFILIYLNKAEMVTYAKDVQLRSVSQSFPMPTIIRLFAYVNLPYRGVMLNRQNIFKRDNFTCQYCSSRKDLTIDHIIPRSKGGRSSWNNLVTACKKCNSKKGNMTIEEANMPLLRPPFKPSFIMFLRDFSGHIEQDWMPYLGKKTKMY